MKNGNWHRIPSVVVQFVHGVSGVVVGLGLLAGLEDPEDAEHGCNKSPEAMSAQLDCQIQQLTVHTFHIKQDMRWLHLLWNPLLPSFPPKVVTPVLVTPVT